MVLFLFYISESSVTHIWTVFKNVGINLPVQ